MPEWHREFLSLVPVVERRAHYAFRHYGAEARQEAVQSTIAAALDGYLRLKQRGLPQAGFVGALARFAILRVQDGRSLGSRRRAGDMLAPARPRRPGFRWQRTALVESSSADWQDLLVVDRHVSPADLAAFRIDFAEWLQRLPSRLSAVALRLALGDTASEVAQQCDVSAPRISQYRAQLAAHWDTFQENSKFPLVRP